MGREDGTIIAFVLEVVILSENSHSRIDKLCALSRVQVDCSNVPSAPSGILGSPDACDDTHPDDPNSQIGELQRMSIHGEKCSPGNVYRTDCCVVCLPFNVPLGNACTPSMRRFIFLQSIAARRSNRLRSPAQCFFSHFQ